MRQLILLTHDTEFTKSSNTGILVAPALAAEPGILVQRLAWSRVAPDPSLLQMAAAGELMLLYPTPQALVLRVNAELATQGDTSATMTAIPTFFHDNEPFPQIRGFVLLDATWQLAHKMYRQSPYLQNMPGLMLHCSQPSQYLLRRNQRQQGWCTAESVALLLTAIGRQNAASRVLEAFHQFNQRN